MQKPRLPQSKFVQRERPTKAQNLVLLTVPESWMPPLSFLIRHAAKNPAVAAFPGQLLAAYNEGSQDALKQVLHFAAAASFAAGEAGSGLGFDEINITSAAVWLANHLATAVLNGDTPAQKKAAAEREAAEQAERAAAVEQEHAVQQEQAVQQEHAEDVAVKQEPVKKTRRPRVDEKDFFAIPGHMTR